MLYFPLSVLLALVEIEIEGPRVWMTGNKNTVRIDSKILKFLFGKKKNFTMYHVFMFTLVLLLILHPVINAVETLNWVEIARKTLETFGLYILFITFLEDFLYFVFNESHTIRNITKEKMTWNESWIFGIPTGYVVCVVISGILLSISCGFLNFLGLTAITTMGVFVCICIAQKYHGFRKRGLENNHKKPSFF